MKKLQPHFEELLRKLNLISKKQSYKNVMTATYFGFLGKGFGHCLYIEYYIQVYIQVYISGR